MNVGIALHGPGKPGLPGTPQGHQGRQAVSCVPPRCSSVEISESQQLLEPYATAPEDTALVGQLLCKSPFPNMTVAYDFFHIQEELQKLCSQVFGAEKTDRTLAHKTVSTPVTGLPGRVPGQKYVFSLGSEYSISRSLSTRPVDSPLTGGVTGQKLMFMCFVLS